MRFEYIRPELQMRTSQGFVKDVSDPASSIREPLTEYQVMLDLIQQDPTLARAFDIITDFATYNGYDFTGGKKSDREKLRHLFYNKLNFDEVQPNLIRTLCYYGDAFLELRKQGSKTPNELWVLETTEMRIEYDVHGKVTGYWQRPFKMSGLSTQEILDKEKTHGVFFKPEEVVHFRIKWLGSQIYSYNPVEAASTAISTRLYAQNYLMKIFTNMPPGYHMHLAGIGKQDYKSAKEEFQSAKTRYQKRIAITKSSDPNSRPTITKIDAPYDEQLLKVMSYLRNEILTSTGVPRSWLQESASENRGITEAEQRPFDVKIKAIQRNIIGTKINIQLLPALGFSRNRLMDKEDEEEEGMEGMELGVKKKKKEKEDEFSKLMFRYNEISVKGETETLQNAGLLRDMGLKPKSLVRFLDERGIVGLDPSDFDENQLRKNLELNPSREGMDPNKKDMTNKLGEKGTSDDGAKKIKEKQMQTRSTSFDQYPYTMR